MKKCNISTCINNSTSISPYCNIHNKDSSDDITIAYVKSISKFITLNDKEFRKVFIETKKPKIKIFSKL
jgi:hypothetical protein